MWVYQMAMASSSHHHFSLWARRESLKKDSKVEGLFLFEADVFWPEKMEKRVESESEYQIYQSQM